MSIEWALWLMKATIARMVMMPRATPMATVRLGMTGSPPASNDDRTERNARRQ